MYSYIQDKIIITIIYYFIFQNFFLTQILDVRRCLVHSAKYKVQSTKYTVRSTQYKLRGSMEDDGEKQSIDILQEKLVRKLFSLNHCTRP